MSIEEIQAVLAEYHGKPPTITESERYEDSEQFVGQVFGEKHEFTTQTAEKFFEAAKMFAGDSCGNGCDSNCSCF